MASNHLRILFNLQRGLIYRNIPSTFVRFNSTHHSILNFKKLTRNVNNVRLIQTRFETTQTNNKQEKILPGSSSSFKSFSKYLVAFIGGVFGYYAIMMYVDFFEDKADTSPAALKYKPGFIEQVSKKIDRGGVNPGNVKITLYQYTTCPFCCKVRAYLDYYGYSYDIIEVNSVIRKQLKWSDYRKVPILAVQVPVQCDLKTKEMIYDTNFIQINDSSVIISALDTYRLHPSTPLDEIVSYYQLIESKDSRGKPVYDYPNKYFIMLQDKRVSSAEALNNYKDEREWRQWVDSKFMHVIAPNVYRTLKESLDAFNWFDKAGEWGENFNTFERYCAKYLGAIAMYFISKRLKTRYELKDDVRESLYESANEWADAVGTTNKFRGGDVPNLSDLALYGALNSFKGCEAFADLMRNTKIKTWYENCRHHVRASKGKDRLNVIERVVEEKPPEIIGSSKPIEQPQKSKKRFWLF